MKTEGADNNQIQTITNLEHKVSDKSINSNEYLNEQSQ
jgi:hypothetical protein